MAAWRCHVPAAAVLGRHLAGDAVSSCRGRRDEPSHDRQFEVMCPTLTALRRPASSASIARQQQTTSQQRSHWRIAVSGQSASARRGSTDGRADGQPRALLLPSFGQRCHLQHLLNARRLQGAPGQSAAQQHSPCAGGSRCCKSLQTPPMTSVTSVRVSCEMKHGVLALHGRLRAPRASEWAAVVRAPVTEDEHRMTSAIRATA